MPFLFYGITNVLSLDVSNFDTSNVEKMNYMFANNTNLVSLDLSNFITDKVTTVERMFAGNYDMVNLDMRNADFSNVTNSDYMFHYVNNNIEVIVKDATAKTFIESQLTNGGTVVIA